MITTEGLTRTFRSKDRTVEAVRGIDLSVGEGELLAFLGPNGAGKSTTLRMLTTLLRPTAGRAVVAGHDVSRDPNGVRRRIGYVGQGDGASHSQLVRDELVAQGRCYGLSAAESSQRATSCSTRSSSRSWPAARRARCRVVSAGGSTSRWGSSTAPRCCSSTSRRPDSTRRAARTSGATSCACVRRPG